MFSMPNEQSIWKTVICEKQEDRNVSKGEYRRVIRILLPGLSVRFLQGYGKLKKMLSFLYSSYTLGFLTRKFLSLTSKFPQK